MAYTGARDGIQYQPRICIICGNVDGFEGVSLHRFPANDEFRRLWRLFVENNGVNVQLIVNSSKLCSRHFVPGLDYRETRDRRRLFNRAVPSLVSDI
ncbi:uncharacterized protein LOC112594869 [Melanaphis sacchari]|uniref:uncharacterized protein LOC112594869 n=1 Tax=Melanaphis sacchari TaxID=742174 RepID=UPI000DC1318B|nr:uncharacterized protein LOC112594869 [Melanaphis sacchari]